MQGLSRRGDWIFLGMRKGEENDAKNEGEC